jgi:acylphosphatase
VSEARAIRCVVAGRVQGVNYRAATADQAERLGVDGWVKNLADGRVEVVAGGEASAVAMLTSWLWDGPPSARVSAVHIEEWTAAVPRGFTVAR